MGVADSLTTTSSRKLSTKSLHSVARVAPAGYFGEAIISAYCSLWSRFFFFPPPIPASLAIECKGGIVPRIESAERKHKRERGSKESRCSASTTLFDRKKFPNERKWIVTRKLMTLLVEYRGILCWRNNERERERKRPINVVNVYIDCFVISPFFFCYNKFCNDGLLFVIVFEIEFKKIKEKK